MPRPKQFRKIHKFPGITLFKPQGVPSSVLDTVDLSLDEYEALRLADIENLEQIEAAEKMKVSRSTFQRLITSAHSKIAEALVNGKGIKIHKMIDFNFPKRENLRQSFGGRGRGRCHGRMNRKFD